MEKQKVNMILSITVTLMLLVASIVMLRLTFVIRSNGGKCTASPLAYSEMKMKESTGEDYKCSCVRNYYPELPSFT